jgi:hypothetical protein
VSEIQEAAINDLVGKMVGFPQRKILDTKQNKIEKKQRWCKHIFACIS